MTHVEVILTEFLNALDAYDRKRTVQIASDAIKNKILDIPTLYEAILAPSLTVIASNTNNQTIPIWDEHLRSNIVRTVLENMYPLIVDTVEPNGKQALMLCLEEEYHDIGARMISDYLTLLGYNTFFIGANTPKKEIIHAVEYLAPDLVCISVSNYYHLTRLHSLVESLKTSNAEPFKIVIGGYAVHHTSNVRELVKADFYANTYDDLSKIKEALL